MNIEDATLNNAVFLSVYSNSSRVKTLMNNSILQSPTRTAPAAGAAVGAGQARSGGPSAAASQHPLASHSFPSSSTPIVGRTGLSTSTPNNHTDDSKLVNGRRTDTNIHNCIYDTLHTRIYILYIII